MNSAHCLLLLTNAFLWILPVLFGHPQLLPEVIEETNEDSSTCYGTLKQFQPSCFHRPGTVIGVQAVKVGAKQTSLDCPENVPDAEERNDTCCTPNATTDCIQVFDYMKSFIPDKYKFHNLCSGYPQCITSAETVWAQTDCDNSTAEYMKNTNYMFMEFSCIDESKIGNMCSDQNYTGSTVYLQSPEYPNRNISADINKCACHVTSSSDVVMYTLDVRLYGQTLTVADQVVSQIYNESSSTMFNITSAVLTGKDVWLTLDTSSTDNGAFVWVGFEATNSLTISCKVFGLKETDTDTSSPETPNNSTTPSKSDSSTYGKTSSSPETPGIIPVIIGAVAGVLLLLLFVLLVCYLVKRKNRNRDRNRKTSTLMQDDKESEISRSTRRSFDHARHPMNEKFKTSSIYSNKVEPTRYIEEHGNLKSNQVLPSIGRSSRRLSPELGNGFMYQPTRLPPLSNGNMDALRSVDEISTTDQRQRKKSKKRKSHKHKHRDQTMAEDEMEDRLHGTADTNARRHSDNNKRRSSDNERKHSDNNARRNSDNERKHSDNNARRNSDNERKHSDNNERRHSKERRKHRHSSKKSEDY